MGVVVTTGSFVVSKDREGAFSPDAMANPRRSRECWVWVLLGMAGCAGGPDGRSSVAMAEARPYSALRQSADDSEVVVAPRTADRGLPPDPHAEPPGMPGARSPAVDPSREVVRPPTSPGQPTNSELAEDRAWEAEQRVDALATRGGEEALETIGPGRTVEEHLVFALARERLGDRVAAHAQVRAVLAEWPDQAPALLCLARLELARGDAAAAAEAIDRAQASLHGSGRIHRDLALLTGVCALYGNDPERGERLLREELGTGQRPADAALNLANYLGRAERLPEALAALEAAAEREPDRVDVGLARARVLNDLGRVADSIAVLDDLAERQPHPRVLLAAAHAQRTQGHREAARRYVRQILEKYSDDPWVVARRSALDEYDAELGQEDNARFTGRELLSLVRSSPNAVLRVRALRTLAEEEADELAAALRLGLADPEHVVRLAALRLGWPVAADKRAWVRGGLDDSAAAVRGAAADMAALLPEPQAIPLLLSFLDQEDDGYVFEKMHDALRKLFKSDDVVPPGRTVEKRDRDEMRIYWRKRWRQ